MPGMWIADIGGSSSRWARLDRDGLPAERFEDLPGYNPASADPAPFVAGMRSRMRAHVHGSDKGTVVVYGAGCGNQERGERMHQVVQSLFPGARVEVHSDLLGAARGAFEGESGLALILGTGMNAGHFDGTRLDRTMPSLGYLLGDEGSGADLGRHLLNALHYGRLTPSTVGRLFPEGAPELANTIQRIQGSPTPARELAAHAARLANAPDDPFVRELLADRFGALACCVEHFFAPAERGDVRAVGSIAFHFEAPLRMALERNGSRLTVVSRDPMQGLLRYHAKRAR